MRHIVLLFVVVTLVGSSVPGWADSESTAVEIGSAAGSAFGTMIYAPFKATFCILGGMGSGRGLAGPGEGDTNKEESPRNPKIHRRPPPQTDDPQPLDERAEVPS